MRNRDEFKSLIYDKCEEQRALQRKRRRRVVAIISPLAACFVFCCVIFVGSQLSQDKNATSGYQEYGDDNDGLSLSERNACETKSVVSVNIITKPEAKELTRNYTDEQKISNIISYFEGLPLSDITESVSPESEDIQYFVTINYSDGIALTYIQKDNKYLQVDSGEWKEIDYDEAMQLEVLIDEMPSD